MASLMHNTSALPSRARPIFRNCITYNLQGHRHDNYCFFNDSVTETRKKREPLVRGLLPITEYKLSDPRRSLSSFYSFIPAPSCLFGNRTRVFSCLLWAGHTSRE